MNNNNRTEEEQKPLDSVGLKQDIIKLGLSVLLLGFGLYVALLTFVRYSAVQINNNSPYTMLSITIPILIAVTYVIILSLIWGFFSQGRTKTISRGVFLVAALAVITAYYTEDIDNATVIPQHYITLSEYQPFFKGTKAVSLNEKVNLKLEKDLPTLDGARQLYPLYASIVQTVYPKQEYAYDKMETDVSRAALNTEIESSMKLLIDDLADIVFSENTDVSFFQEASQKSVELIYTPIAKDATVFFVNKNNPVSDIKHEDIQKIYAKEITSWKEIGGKDESIIAFQYPKNTDIQRNFLKFMSIEYIPAYPPIEFKMIKVKGIIKEAADYRNYDGSIGFTSFYSLQDVLKKYGNEIKVISVDGVNPEKKNIKNGSYPVVHELFAVTAMQSEEKLAEDKKRDPLRASRRNKQRENTHKLLEWLISGQGQSLIEHAGFSSVLGVDQLRL